MTAASLMERRTSVDIFLARAMSGLFGLGYIMVKDVPVETRTFLILMIIDFLQLAAFPLNSSPAFPWGETPVAGLSSLLNYITTDTVDVTHSETAFKVILALGTVWVGMFLFMAVHVAKNFLEDAPQQAMELRLLRSIALLSTTTLFLPLTAVLFRGLACPHEHWLETPLTCNSPGRIGISIAIALMLVGFSFLSLFVAAVFIDRDPASNSWSARSHGRVDVVLLCNKLLLSFFFNVLNEVFVGHWTLTAIIIAGGCLWFYLMVKRMPLAHEWINSLQAGFALGYTWLCISLAIAQGVPQIQAWLLVYVSTPLVIAIGYYIASTQARKVVTQPLEECRTVDEANAWARARMQVYRQLLQNGDNGGTRSHAVSSTGSQRPPTSGIAGSIAAAAGSVVRRIATFRSEMPGPAAPMVGRGAAAQRFEDTATVASRKYAAPASVTGSASAPSHHRHTQEPAPVEDPVDQMRATIMREARQGYSYMTAAFADKEIAYMLAASFYEHHSKWNFEEATALARSIPRSPALDTRFQVYRRSRQMRESDGTGLSPIDRILFDQKMKEVSQMRMTAFRTIQEVWSTLASQMPDLQTLSGYAKDLDQSLEQIEKTYLDLLRINSDSVRVLRGYASFLSDIRNDAARAQEFLNKADRVDELATRSIARGLKHVEFGTSGDEMKTFDENAAIVTVSAFEANLGEVLKVTPGATRMFGFSSKSYMIGQNVSILMPSPVRDVHNTLLRRFKGQTTSPVVNKSRLLVGMKRSGTIFPVWLAVMEAPPDEVTCEPRFQAYFGEVVTTEEMIIFGGEEDDYCMYGCTSGMERLLGLTGEVVQAEKPSMLNWFPTLSKTYDPQEVRLEENQAEWLKRGVSQGEVTGPLAQLVGGAGSVDKSATFKLPRSGGARHRANVTTVAQPLLTLVTQGIIPLSETTRDADADSIGDDAMSANSDENDLLNLRAKEQDLLFGSVKPFAHPAIPKFYVLTCRAIPRESDAAAAIASPGSPIRRGNNESQRGDTSASPRLSRQEHDSTIPQQVSRGPMEPYDRTISEREHEDDEEDEEEEESEGGPDIGGDSNLLSARDPPDASLSPLLDGKMLGGAVKQLPTNKIVAFERGSSVSERSAREVGPDSAGILVGNKGRRIISSTSTSGAKRVILSQQTSSHHSHSIHGRKSRQRRSSAAGSVNAHSIASGASSKAGITTQLRRSLDTLRSVVEPEVSRVRRVLLALVVAVFVMAIVINLWINSTWTRVQLGSNSIRLAGRRSVELSRGVGAVILLSAANDGLPEWITGHTKDELIDILFESSANMASSIERLYELGEEGGPTGHSFETTREFDIPDPFTGEIQHETILEVSTRLSTILGRLALRGENVTITNDDVTILLSDTPYLRNELQDSLAVRHEDALHVFASAQVELAAGGIAFFTLCVLLSSFFLLQSVRSLARRTRRTLMSFLFLPHRLSKAFQQRASLMLQEVVSEVGDEAADGETEGVNVEEREQTALIADEKCAEEIERVLEDLRVQAATRFAAHLDDDTNGTGDDLAVMTVDEAGGGHREEEGKVIDGKVRRFRDSSKLIGSRAWILLSPVVAVLFLLGAIFTWQSLGAGSVTESANRVVALERSGRGLAALAADYSGAVFHPNVSKRNLYEQDLVAEQKELVAMIELSLLGGELRAVESTAVIPLANDPKDPVYQVLAHDACIAAKSMLSHEQYEFCRTFDEELLQHGAVAATKVVVSASERGIQVVEAGDHLDPSSSPTAYPPVLNEEFATKFQNTMITVSPYLQIAIDYAARNEDSSINGWATAVAGGNIVVTWIVSIIICLFSLTYIWRQAGDIALPLRSAQSLLAIMPSEAINIIPALNREIRLFVTSTTLNRNTSSGSCCSSRASASVAPY